MNDDARTFCADFLSCRAVTVEACASSVAGRQPRWAGVVSYGKCLCRVYSLPSVLLSVIIGRYVSASCISPFVLLNKICFVMMF
jgi:hypothetical protein